MATVFTHSPLAGDTWDMQGALLYFGTIEKGQTKAGTGATVDTTSTEYAKSSSEGDIPIVATGVSLSLQRQVAKRYPINVRRVIYMVGKPEGQMQINCLFGPNQTMSTFLKKFNALGNDNTVASNGTCIFIKPFGTMYTAKTKTEGGGTSKTGLGLGTWCVTDPVINGIGLQITEAGTAQVPAVANVSFTFTSLDITDEQGTDVKKGGNGWDPFNMREAAIASYRNL